MNIIFNVNTLDFDQLGSNRALYNRVIDSLPADLQGKAREARFGYLNPSDTPEPKSNAETALEDEIKRMVATGRAIVVDEKGQIVDAGAYQAPTTVVGDGGSYGYLIEFGGEQNIFIPATASGGFIDALGWQPTPEQVAVMCLNIR